MEKKEYRVICWQPEFVNSDDEVFADIVPADGVIHDMIFYSRLQIFRANQPNLMICDVAKSVYLNVVDDGEPEIIFAQETAVSQERLRSIILRTYKKMKAAGQNSTLSYMLSAPEAENYASRIKTKQQEKFQEQQRKFSLRGQKTDEEVFMECERRKRCMFAQKHRAQLTYPQTPQEEQIKQKQEEFAYSIKLRREIQQMHAERDAKVNPITRMKAKMMQYSGD